MKTAETKIASATIQRKTDNAHEPFFQKKEDSSRTSFFQENGAFSPSGGGWGEEQREKLIFKNFLKLE